MCVGGGGGRGGEGAGCVEGCQGTGGLMYSEDYSDLLVCVHIAVLFLDRPGALEVFCSSSSSSSGSGGGGGGGSSSSSSIVVVVAAAAAAVVVVFSQGL